MVKYQKKLKEWQVKKTIEQRMNRKNYPVSPSAGPGIMRLYKKYFKQALGRKKKAKVMVLGATPELRDLTLKYGHQLTTADFSMEAITKMSQLMKYQNSPNETIVKANWLDTLLKDNLYDLIMGDAVVCNVLSKQDKIKFFQEMKRLLKPRSYLLIREAVILPEKEKRTFEEILQDFRERKIHWFDWFLETVYYSSPTPKWYNLKTKTYSLKKFFEEFKKFYQKGLMAKKEFNTLWWFKSDLTFSVYSKKDFENLFKKYFQLLPTQQAKDYRFCEFSRFHLGRAKRNK